MNKCFLSDVRQEILNLGIHRQITERLQNSGRRCSGYKREKDT